MENKIDITKMKAQDFMNELPEISHLYSYDTTIVIICQAEISNLKDFFFQFCERRFCNDNIRTVLGLPRLA